MLTKCHRYAETIFVMTEDNTKKLMKCLNERTFQWKPGYNLVILFIKSYFGFDKQIYLRD